jgi:hypothetical protein
MSEFLLVLDVPFDHEQSLEFYYMRTPRPKEISSNEHKRLQAIATGIAICIEERTSIQMKPIVGYLIDRSRGGQKYGGILNFEPFDPDSNALVSEAFNEVSDCFIKLNDYMSEIKTKDRQQPGSTTIHHPSAKPTATDTNTEYLIDDLPSFLIIREIRKQAIEEPVTLKLANGLSLSIPPSKSGNQFANTEEIVTMKVQDVSQSKGEAHLLTPKNKRVGKLFFDDKHTHELLKASTESLIVELTVKKISSTQNGQTNNFGYQLQKIHLSPQAIINTENLN